MRKLFPLIILVLLVSCISQGAKLDSISIVSDEGRTDYPIGAILSARPGDEIILSFDKAVSAGVLRDFTFSQQTETRVDDKQIIVRVPEHASVLNISYPAKYAGGKSSTTNQLAINIIPKDKPETVTSVGQTFAVRAIQAISKGYVGNMVYNDQHKILVVERGELYMYFSSGVDKTVADLLGAEVQGGSCLKFILDGRDRIHIPASIKSLSGQQLDREYNYEFVYIPAPGLITATVESSPLILVRNQAGSIILPGEKVIFKLNWPFTQPEVGRAFGEGLRGAKCVLEWVDEATFEVTFYDIESIVLEIGSLTDTYGNVFPEPLFMFFSVAQPKSLKQLNLATGEVKKSVIPIGISSAIQMTNGYTQAILERSSEIYGINHQLWTQKLLYDVRQQIIIEDLGSGWKIDPQVLEAQQLIGANKGIKPYYVGLAHSKQQAAALQLEINGEAKVQIYDSSGLLKEYNSLAVVDEDDLAYYLGHPLEPGLMYWLSDDNSLVYSIRGITYQLDLASGREIVLFQGGTLIGLSPDSTWFVMAKWNYPYNEYFLVNTEGEQRRISQGNGRIEICTWLDPATFLYNLDGACYLFDLTAGRSQLLSSGNAFDYDKTTGTIFILDTDH